jgi:hypothetical protein
MDQNEENFDQLRQLMKLKRHEVPPPGYFNRLPAEIISEIRAERREPQDSVSRLATEAPWLMRFWGALEAKPLFGGAFGAAVCALILGALYLSEKPAERPTNVPLNAGADLPFASTTIAPANGEIVGSPLLLAATNLNNASGPNLFDQMPMLQTAPVSHTPGN